jgi:hypothetical protein
MIVLIDKSEMPCLWEIIWSRLTLIEGDRVCKNRGEVWQYMGSKIVNNKVIHTFRHHCHPSSNLLKYQHISTEFTGEVIDQ